LVGIVNLLVFTASLGAKEISSCLLEKVSLLGEKADAASLLKTEFIFIVRVSDIDAETLCPAGLAF